MAEIPETFCAEGEDVQLTVRRRRRKKQGRSREVILRKSTLAQWIVVIRPEDVVEPRLLSQQNSFRQALSLTHKRDRSGGFGGSFSDGVHARVRVLCVSLVAVQAVEFRFCLVRGIVG